MSEATKTEASPPQHPARAAGQRWRLTILATGEVREGTLSERLTEAGDWACELALGFGSACWSVPDLFTMTLLAPQGDAVTCNCPHGKYQTQGTCRVHATPGIVSGGKADCACALCRPAKAPTPVCLLGKRGELHGGAVAMRHWRNMYKDMCSAVVCDLHYLRECEPKGGGSDVLHNTKIPARLARPRRAHSMGVEDDTLEDA